MEIPEINKRIRSLVDLQTDGNVKKFSDLINVPQQNVNRLFNIDSRTKKYPTATTEILVSITETLDTVDAKWLLTGKGEMCKAPDSSNIVNENEEEYGKIKIFSPEDLPKQIGKLYRAPIYESYPVSAGRMGLAEVREEKPDGYAYTTLPGIIFFPVVGCSFEPIISAGQYIGVVKLNSWDRIDTEKIYYILTREERMLKRLRIDEENNNILWCVSPNFGEFKIYKEDILEINHVFFHGQMI